MVKKFPLYLILWISCLAGQEIKWENYPDRTALNITTDTPGIPVYVDGIKVGVAPLPDVVVVVPGWHRISYFPDTDNPYEPILPKDRRIRDIIRLGTVNVLAEKGQVVDVVLNYNRLEEEIRAYRRSVRGGRWIGFTMMMLVLLILTRVT